MERVTEQLLEWVAQLSEEVGRIWVMESPTEIGITPGENSKRDLEAKGYRVAAIFEDGARVDG